MGMVEEKVRLNLGSRITVREPIQGLPVGGESPKNIDVGASLLIHSYCPEMNAYTVSIWSPTDGVAARGKYEISAELLESWQPSA